MWLERGLETFQWICFAFLGLKQPFKETQSVISFQKFEGRNYVTLLQRFQGWKQTWHQLCSTKSASQTTSAEPLEPVFPFCFRKPWKNDPACPNRGKHRNRQNCSLAALRLKLGQRGKAAKHQPQLCPHQLPRMQRQPIYDSPTNNHEVLSQFS